MDFDLDQRTARMGVGEFSDFAVGPRDGGAGQAGLWRAQLGTQWHRQLREQAAAGHPDAEFERPIEGSVARRGWTITLSGRIDQIVPVGGVPTLREVKSVTRPLPEGESALRADYPGYFIQLAAYAALLAGPAPRAELVFVECGSGLVQTVALTPADRALFDAQLDKIAGFLDLRLRGRDRLRNLRFNPPFSVLRPGQESARGELDAAIAGGRSALLLEAPTGFGKTGVLLEFALNQLRSGHFDPKEHVARRYRAARHRSDGPRPRDPHIGQFHPGQGRLYEHAHSGRFQPAFSL